MSGWKQFFLRLAAVAAYRLADAALAAWRQHRRPPLLSLPDALQAGHTIADPDTGERWVIASVQLSQTREGGRLLSLDLTQPTPTERTP